MTNRPAPRSQPSSTDGPSASAAAPTAGRTHDSSDPLAAGGLALRPAAHVDHFSEVHLGDCVEVMRTMPDACIDAVITDPPYAIGRVQDADAEDDARRQAALMSAPMLGMQSTNWHDRATHSRGYADNDSATFTQWCSLWLAECIRVLKPGGHIVVFGGTRTWHRLAGAVEDAGFEIRDSLAWLYATGVPKSLDVGREVGRFKADRPPAPELGSASGSTAWEGWGTALKPAHEPIVLARKPLVGTVAANVVAYGTGALNLTSVRIDHGGEVGSRWPSNVFLDADRAEELNKDAGASVSRFFWVAKPDAGERPRVDGVSHPTVKPVRLMRELVRLVTTPGGIVLDPFAGSGTTVEACLLEGRQVVAVEREPGYVPLIVHRIDRNLNPARAIAVSETDQGLFSLFDD